MRQPPPDGHRGYLTLAARTPMYLEMAVDLALSLRETNADPLSLIVDRKLRTRAHRHYRSVFDHILDLPETYDFGRALKLCAAELTPYERTFFVDADTLALGSMEPFWERMAPRSFAMMGETLSCDDETLHHERPVRWWCERFGLDSYFKTAGAVVYFTREEGRRIFGRCFRIYRDRVFGRVWTGDEIAFAVLAAEEPIPVLEPPAPILWPDDLTTLDLADPSAPLFTVLGSPPTRVMDALMVDVVRRRSAAGLPGGSSPYWRLKADSNNPGRLRRWLKPLRRWLVDVSLATSRASR